MLRRLERSPARIGSLPHACPWVTPGVRLGGVQLHACIIGDEVWKRHDLGKEKGGEASNNHCLKADRRAGCSPSWGEAPPSCFRSTFRRPWGAAAHPANNISERMGRRAPQRASVACHLVEHITPNKQTRVIGPSWQRTPLSPPPPPPSRSFIPLATRPTVGPPGRDSPPLYTEGTVMLQFFFETEGLISEVLSFFFSRGFEKT